MNDYLDDELEDLETEESFEDGSDETPPGDIVAFNEARSCADLYRLHQAKQLNIKPDYQRDIIWKASDQTRFIDSLAKQLPIPSMCLSFDYKSDKREVVDGLQRMSSIIRFLGDDDWRLSNLPDIDNRISNKTVGYIKKTNPEIFSRIQNTTIPVTVLRCDLSKRAHQEYLFTIFHRLNTGGSKLTNQEIRNCIYSGKFNKMLQKVVANDVYRELFSIDDKKIYRFSNEELVLRIIALSRNFEKYRGPLSKFLNSFMAKYREISSEDAKVFRKEFEDTLKIVYERILSEEPLPRLSKATIEALFVAVIRNRKTLANRTEKELQVMYKNLREDPLFSLDALKEGLAATDRVIARLARAVEIFA